MKNKINWRSFVSVFMGYSLITMTITGIVLYIAPPGRIAHWTEWRFLGFTKEEWQALHTLFSFTWVIAAIYHVIYNWKPFVNYIRRKAKTGLQLRKEFAYATLAVFIIFFGTYFNIPPFKYVMDLGEYATDSWANETNEPPIPHAELLTLGEFSRTVNMPPDKIINTLKQNKFTVKDTSQTVQELAESNNTTPSKIYLLLKVQSSLDKQSTATAGKFSQGSGVGRKKLSEILAENNIPWEQGIGMLKEKGIEVRKDSKLKDIASDNGVSPIEIIKALNLL